MSPGPCEAKCHYLELLMDIVRLEGCLVLLARNQSNLLKTGLEIEFGKPTCSGQLIEKLVDDWNRIFSFYYQCIQVSVVDD
jgi:hypothetical protein